MVWNIFYSFMNTCSAVSYHTVSWNCLLDKVKMACLPMTALYFVCSLLNGCCAISFSAQNSLVWLLKLLVGLTRNWWRQRLEVSIGLEMHKLWVLNTSRFLTASNKNYQSYIRFLKHTLPADVCLQVCLISLCPPNSMVQVKSRLQPSGNIHRFTCALLAGKGLASLSPVSTGIYGGWYAMQPYISDIKS